MTTKTKTLPTKEKQAPSQIAGNDLLKLQAILSLMPFKALETDLIMQYCTFKLSLDDAIQKRANIMKQMMNSYGLKKPVNGKWEYKTAEETKDKVEEIQEKLEAINDADYEVRPLNFFSLTALISWAESATTETVVDNKATSKPVLAMNDVTYLAKFLVVKS